MWRANMCFQSVHWLNNKFNHLAFLVPTVLTVSFLMIQIISVKDQLCHLWRRLNSVLQLRIFFKLAADIFGLWRLNLFYFGLSVRSPLAPPEIRWSSLCAEEDSCSPKAKPFTCGRLRLQQYEICRLWKPEKPLHNINIMPACPDRNKKLFFQQHWYSRMKYRS